MERVDDLFFAAGIVGWLRQKTPWLCLVAAPVMPSIVGVLLLDDWNMRDCLFCSIRTLTFSGRARAELRETVAGWATKPGLGLGGRVKVSGPDTNLH